MGQDPDMCICLQTIQELETQAVHYDHPLLSYLAEPSPLEESYDWLAEQPRRMDGN